MKNKELAVIGAGNIGAAIALGLVEKAVYPASAIVCTRRSVRRLEKLSELGFETTRDNAQAVRAARTILIAVEPQEVDHVLSEIAGEISSDRHLVISVVSGISINQIQRNLGSDVPVVRAMPNTAIAIGESMTCLSSNNGDQAILKRAEEIFEAVGETLFIAEEKMIPATALAACGIAFFLRAVRAASQGGIEIGFSSEDSLKISAQVAKGAAALILGSGNHPEREIDKVTTPRGCTIAGLNQMEHEGFSSAMIRGIITSSDKASKLYQTED